MFYIYLCYLPLIHCFLMKSFKNFRSFSIKSNINDYKDYNRYLNQQYNSTINNMTAYSNFLKPSKHLS
jgi:hypothetical protein